MSQFTFEKVSDDSDQVSLLGFMFAHVTQDGLVDSLVEWYVNPDGTVGSATYRLSDSDISNLPQIGDDLIEQIERQWSNGELFEFLSLLDGAKKVLRVDDRLDAIGADPGPVKSYIFWAGAGDQDDRRQLSFDRLYRQTENPRDDRSTFDDVVSLTSHQTAIWKSQTLESSNGRSITEVYGDELDGRVVVWNLNAIAGVA